VVKRTALAISPEMQRHQRDVQALAVGLAALAGYVDAVAFLQTRGSFVSFMSGNTTRLGGGLASDYGKAVVAAALIVTFVIGVAIRSLAGHAARWRRRPAVLLLVAALLSAAAVFAPAQPAAAIGLMALAMGAENAVFERDGEIQIGLTYMTGTLVKLGQRLALAVRGRDPMGWASYVLMWLGLLSGGVAGAIAHARFGMPALWGAALASAVLAALAVVFDGRHPAIDPRSSSAR
jgi:uncharacterized membrane protein YoaK (UPF0700 family)